MKVLYLFNLLLLSYAAVGQSADRYPLYIKLSGGYAFFGTGDISGFGLYTEFAYNILKTPRAFCARLLVGGEISYENGVINPEVKNISTGTYLGVFHHTTTTGLAAKISCYPFSDVLQGLHFTLGPVLAYTNQSYEDYVAIYYQPVPRRESQLAFDNRWIAGYRVGTGYEFFLGDRCVAGVRADFCNYNNGDVNSLLAAKLGYRF